MSWLFLYNDINISVNELYLEALVAMWCGINISDPEAKRLAEQ